MGFFRAAKFFVPRTLTKVQFHNVAASLLKRENDSNKAKAPVEVKETESSFDPDTTPVTHAQGFVRGGVVGVSTPLVTLPLDKLNIKFQTQPTVEVAATLKKQPYKGYGMVAATNVARSCSVFAAQPYIYDQVVKKVEDPEKAKTISYMGAATTEAVFMAPLAVIKQKLLRSDSTANVKQAVVKLKQTGFMRRQIVRTAVTGSIAGIIFWPLYVNLVAKGEKAGKHLSNAMDCGNGFFLNVFREFFVGSMAGGIASFFSYPLINFQAKLNQKPHITAVKMLRDAAYSYGFQNIKSVSALNEAVKAHGFRMVSDMFRGYTTANVRMAAGMGMTNVATHAADYLYHGFFRFRNEMQQRAKVSTMMDHEKLEDFKACIARPY